MANEITIKEFFDDAFRHVLIDANLAKELYRYQVGFVNKNSEHMEFFGGNLLGVHVVRFTEKDSNKFFNDILDVDNFDLKDQIDELPGINPTWKVSSDPFNLSCVYLIHKFLTSKVLPKDVINRAVIDTGLILNYKYITSLLAGYFKYPADPKIAQAVYAGLSNRYLIKKLGNWQEVLTYRAKELVEPESIWLNTLRTFTPDKDVVDMVNDTQGRIRDMVKNITAEFMTAHAAGEKIYNSSNMGLDGDGEEVVKDKVHGPEMYQNYLLSVMADENSFIREELVTVVCRVMTGMQIRNFRNTLFWLSRNAHDTFHEMVEKFVRNVLIYSIDYLSKHGYLLRDSKDLAGIVSKLKNLYLSSRSSDPELAEIRDVGLVMVKEACGKTSDQAAAAIRTGIILYICIRAFTKHYYAGR